MLVRNQLALCVCAIAWLYAQSAIAAEDEPGAVVASASGGNAIASSGVAPSPLLAIDQNRSTVVDRIVVEWGDALGASSAGLSTAQLQTLLSGLRADHLLAASLAGSLRGLRDVIATSLVSTADVASALAAAKTLGDAADDVAYTPVTPCRLIETRGTFAAVYQGDGTSAHHPVPFAPNEVRNYTVQGGNGVCLGQLPAGLAPAAVQLQVFAIPVSGSSSGDVEILPQGSAFGSTATLVYLGNVALTSASTTARINLANDQIGVQVTGGGAHLAIDVVGYFHSPRGGYVASVTASTGIALTGTASAPSIGIAAGGVGTAQIAANAVTQAKLSPTSGAAAGKVLGTNGTNLVWQTDANSGGTVTSITAGAGLSGGSITGSGTIAADPNSTTFTGTYFKQGGNAFGTPAVLGTTDNNPVEIWSGGTRLLRLEPNENVIGGASNNSVVPGTFGATIAGGADNIVGGNAAAIGGGDSNVASGGSSTVAGGEFNVASGAHSMVAGGLFNTASGAYSFAAGRDAQADQAQCAIFDLWSTATLFRCNGWTNVLRIGADNGMSIDYGAQVANGNSNSYVYIGPLFNGNAITTGTGAKLTTGGAWTNSSDRNRKENFAGIDSRQLLERVAAMPVMLWNYKEEGSRILHLGPTAQDFHAAFGLGSDDVSITTVDEGGVALAAIQGLNAKVDEQQREIAALRRALEILMARTSPEGAVAQSH